jgi:hypothetical protein
MEKNAYKTYRSQMLVAQICHPSNWEAEIYGGSQFRARKANTSNILNTSPRKKQ